MTLIDADKFLGYLIFSKHIDSLKCKEVKEAVEMCKVDVLEQIRDEIVEEQSNWREDADAEWHECRRILRIINKYAERTE